MSFVSLCALICILFIGCKGDATQAKIPKFAAHLHNLVDNTSASSKCSNFTSNNKHPDKPFSMHIRMPFMDMDLEHERAVHIVLEPDQHMLFVLHGNELFQMTVSRQDKRLILLGTLAVGGRASEALGAAVIGWHNYLLLAVAYEEWLNIYQLSKVTIAQRVAIALDATRAHEKPLKFDLIQQLSMPGRYRQLHLFKLAEEKVMLLTAVNFTKLQGKYKTFEWLDAYFNPVDEVTLPAIHTLDVIGSQTKYVIAGRAIRAQTKTILTIYEVVPNSMKLQSRQTLTVDARLIHAATFRGHNYIIACGSAQETHCMYFRMADGQFVIYKKRTGKELAFDKFVADDALLVGVRQREVRIFNSGRLDCYSSFTTKESDLSALYTHTNPFNESYLILSYKRPFTTLLRIVELEWEGGNLLRNAASNLVELEDLNPLQRHLHQFEETIGRLRSMLLQRRTAMDTFRHVAHLTTPAKIKLSNPLTLQKATVGTIQLLSEHVRSPVQLLSRVQELRQAYGKRRLTRSFGVGSIDAASTTVQSLKVQRLRVQNLIYDGSLLTGYHLDHLTQPLPILTIRPNVSTKRMQTEKLLTRENYKHVHEVNANHSATTNITNTDPETHFVRELQVERINNMSWQEFYDQLFLRERDTTIEGRLILQSSVKVVNLWSTLLNGLVVEQLFNLRSPQVIQSNIFMSRFFVSQLDAAQVNGLDFAHDIVFRGHDSFIETPVKISQLSISGDIFFTNQSKLARAAADDDQNELQQFYTGKVILNGTLTLKDLLRESSNMTQIVVNGRAFSLDILKSDYLLHNTPQIFDTPIVFGNAKVTTPSLSTSYLNEHPTTEHLLDSGENTFKQPLYIIFMKARIDGDLISEDYNTKLHDLAENIVRYGEVANITGVKQFIAPLMIDELMTLTLNDLNVNDLVLKAQLKHEIDFKNTKHFDALVVAETMNISKNLNASELNNLPLTELLNFDYQLDRLELPYRLEALNVVFHKINGIEFDNFFVKLELEQDKLVLYKDLLVEGNVEFEDNLVVKTINNIDWITYEQSLVRFNESAQLAGRKRFLAEVTITDTLKADTFNGENMESLFNNILLRTTPQVISGYYTFNDLVLTHLDVQQINTMKASEFVDTRAPELVLAGDLIVPKLIVRGNVIGQLESGIDFPNISQHLYALQARQWRNLVVLGDVYWTKPSVRNAQLDYLLNNAVTRSGEQVITGNVRLQRPIIRYMQTKTKIPINIDLEHIAKDALLKNASVTQIVSAPKLFLKDLLFQNVAATNDIGVTSFNGIDIKRFNRSLYRLTSGEPIAGQLYFSKPPIIEHLTALGLVNGINTKDIYQLSDEALPPVQLEHLVIENDLAIGDINGMHLNYLLQNRVPLHGEALEIFGELSFENLILNKHIMLSTINEIPIKNFVLTKSQKLQPITGPKRVQGQLVLDGPVHVMRLNGRDLSESYQQSIFTDRNYNIDSLIIDRATFEGGLIFGTTNMVGAQKKSDMELISMSDDDDEHNADKRVQVTKLKKSKQLLYLDYDYETKVSWQKPSTNVTIDKTIYLPIGTHPANCERRLLELRQARQTGAIYLANITTNLLQANLDDVSIKAENFCKLEYRKVRSKLTISCRNQKRTIGMKKFVETLKIMRDDVNYFVLMHAKAEHNDNHNEIRILKIDNNGDNCSITDWQSLTLGVGTIMRLYPLGDSYVLITNGLVEHHPTLTIYAYEAASQQFVQQQLINGDYDIIELALISPNVYQLLLSCKHCQRINIYMYEDKPVSKLRFEIQQLLKLSVRLGQVQSFPLENERYMLALPETGQNYYHIFKYSYIEGWQHFTYGYFNDIQLAMPLLDSTKLSVLSKDDNFLFLLCNNVKCSLVKPVMQ